MNLYMMITNLDFKMEIEYILEYNEKRGGFHFNPYISKPNTHGWLPVAERLPHIICEKFYH